jgi:hypothetical protein
MVVLNNCSFPLLSATEKNRADLTGFSYALVETILKMLLSVRVELKRKQIVGIKLKVSRN